MGGLLPIPAMKTFSSYGFLTFAISCLDFARRFFILFL